MRPNTRSFLTAYMLAALSTLGVGVVSLHMTLVHGGALARPAAALAVCCMVALLAGKRLRLAELEQRESLRRMELLAAMNVQVNREVLLNEDIELIYRTILNYLFRVFNTATTGSVLTLGEDGTLQFAASRGFNEAFVKNFHLRVEDCFLYQLTGGQMQNARLITNEDFKRIETVFKPGVWQYQSVISAPLFVGDRFFGLLNLDSALPGTFDADDVQIVELFRSQIEVGLLARERYTQKIERYQMDALTGLLTRRYFEDLFKLALDRAIRHKENFVLALFDVDGLKKVNDAAGHLAGDQMLLRIADAVRLSCRSFDTIGRYGGDEFVAAYLMTDIPTMEKKISGIQTRLRAKPMVFGELEYRLAFSYGLASFPQDGKSLEELVAVADRKLYAMKDAHA